MSRNKPRRSRKFPLLTAAAVAAPFVQAALQSGIVGSLNQSSMTMFGANVVKYFTGYNPVQGNWNAAWLLTGYGPIVAVKGVKLGMKLLGTRLPTVGPVALA